MYWRRCHFLFVHCFAKKADNFLPAKLYLSWSRVSDISNGSSAIEINLLAIRCSMCGQAINLQLRLVLGSLAKARAQQAQIDLQ